MTSDGEPHSISDFDVKETIDILNEVIDKLTKCSQTNMLEPCPFCGAEVSIDDIRYMETMNSSDAILSQVVCPKCGAGGPIGYMKSRSAEHWNTRE